MQGMCSNLRLVLRIAASTGGSSPNTASPAGYTSPLIAEPFQSLGVLGIGIAAQAVKFNKTNCNRV